MAVVRMTRLHGFQWTTVYWWTFPLKRPSSEKASWLFWALCHLLELGEAVSALPIYGCFKVFFFKKRLPTCINAHRMGYVSNRPCLIYFAESSRVKKGLSFKAEHQWASHCIYAFPFAIYVIRRTGCNQEEGRKETAFHVYSLNVMFLKGFALILIQYLVVCENVMWEGLATHFFWSFKCRQFAILKKKSSHSLYMLNSLET